MTNTTRLVDRYVTGDRVIAIADVNITSLDTNGFENWDPGQYASGGVLACWSVGRESGVREIIQWDELDSNRLHVTKPNGTNASAGADVGRVRMRIEYDR